MCGQPSKPSFWRLLDDPFWSLQNVWGAMLWQSHVVGTPRSTRSMWPCGWAIHLNCTFYTTQSSTKRERASKNTEKDTSFRHLVEKTHCHRKHWLLPQYLKDERAGSLWVMKFVPHHPQNRWTWGCRSEKIDALGDPRPPTPTFRCTSGWLGAGIDVLGMDHPVGSM